MDDINVPGNIPMENASNFGYSDFLNDSIFGQFIDIIGAEVSDPIPEICPDYDCSAGCNFDDHSQLSVDHQTIIQENFFDYFNVADFDPNYALNTLPSNMMNKVGEHEIDGEQSRAPTPTTSFVTSTNRTKKNTKPDRSKTIISERRRRSRMKEKLYSLRALVPNITKMDKASIIGDAVMYVQDLQMQAKNLKAEIAALESSLTETNTYPQGPSQNVNKMNFTNNHPAIKKILQIEVFQVEEREFYVRLVCNKGFGVAVALFKVLESFSSSKIQSSNLATAAQGYILTFTLNVKECKLDIQLPQLKLLIARAFLNQGFYFETPLS